MIKLFAIVMLATWAPVVLCPPIVILVDRIRLLPARVVGYCFMMMIQIRRDSYHALVLRHELEHLRQIRLFSPLGMGLFLLIHYGWLFLRHRRFGAVYEKSWIEKKARQAMMRATPLPRYILIDGRTIRWVK